MNERKKHQITSGAMKTGGIEEACARYGLGRASMRHVAEDAGAIIRIGKRLLVNYEKVDRYMDSVSL